MKRTLLILIILSCFPLAGFRFDDGKHGGEVLTDGFIDITVESNINRMFFSYPLTGLSLHDAGDTGNINAEAVNITVPVKDFRCENATAYHDFVSLLKADQYPDLSITIPHDELIQYPRKEYVTIHNLVINIAGVSKKYDIICRAENLNSEDSFLMGTLKVRLTDLEIEPPVKYFGLVKIKDEVIVKFGFSYKDYHLAFIKDSG
jgi:hypothetical protein